MFFSAATIINSVNKGAKRQRDPETATTTSHSVERPRFPVPSPHNFIGIIDSLKDDTPLTLTLPAAAGPLRLQTLMHGSSAFVDLHYTCLGSAHIQETLTFTVALPTLRKHLSQFKRMLIITTDAELANLVLQSYDSQNRLVMECTLKTIVSSDDEDAQEQFNGDELEHAANLSFSSDRLLQAVPTCTEEFTTLLFEGKKVSFQVETQAVVSKSFTYTKTGECTTPTTIRLNKFLLPLLAIPTGGGECVWGVDDELPFKVHYRFSSGTLTLFLATMEFE